MRHVYRLALALCAIGLAVGLVAQIRSLLGLGSPYGYVPFLFILVLLGPWFMASGDVIHRDARWQYAAAPFAMSDLERQMLKGKLLHQSRPRWMRKIDYILLTYLLLVLIWFMMKIGATDSHSLQSSWYLPAPVAMLFSSGWMAFYWGFFGTFLEAVKLK